MVTIKDFLISESGAKGKISHEEAKLKARVKKRKLALCRLCGKEVKGLVTHRRLEHKDMVENGDNAICIQCGKMCKTITLLSRHIADAHERHPCNICGEPITKIEKNRPPFLASMFSK